MTALALLGGCATGGYDSNLGTQVVGDGQVIKLAWEADHPFARELANRPIQLIAEYQEQALNHGQPLTQRVTQVVANSRRTAGDARQRSFPLPPSLASIARGPVCLFFRMNDRILPIREAGNGQDTARFRYAEWDSIARRNAIDQVADREMGRINVQLDQNQRSLQDVERQFQQQLSSFKDELHAKGVFPARGLQSSSDCPAIQLPQPQRLEKPYDVVPPEQTQSTAEKICIHRTRNGVDRLGTTGMLNLLPVSIQFFANKRLDLDAMPAGRQKDFAGFYSAFRQWWDEVGNASDYQPELGQTGEIIKVVGFAKPLQQEAIGLLANKSPLSGPEQQAVFRALYAELDAYNSCVADNTEQLDTKRTAWQRRLQAEPTRTQARQEYYQSRCEDIFRIHAQAQRQADENNRSLKASLKTLQNVEAAKPEAPSELPTGRPLNQEACSL